VVQDEEVALMVATVTVNLISARGGGETGGGGQQSDEGPSGDPRGEGFCIAGEAGIQLQRQAMDP
jgi:hypothetical protein